jgi:hypothetical protein
MTYDVFGCTELALGIGHPNSAVWLVLVFVPGNNPKFQAHPRGVRPCMQIWSLQPPCHLELDRACAPSSRENIVAVERETHCRQRPQHRRARESSEAFRGRVDDGGRGTQWITPATVGHEATGVVNRHIVGRGGFWKGCKFSGDNFTYIYTISYRLT